MVSLRLYINLSLSAVTRQLVCEAPDSLPDDLPVVEGA